ncbi:phosphoadenylyl-sulfate reductase [Thioclava sp. A2]|uniref:phosphoadenylyl-sulfate reductase n=1 Tax=Thioclava sp. FCG-A2 TaxID=3080562 RepID=UPI00295354A0|nr:phosphoadenylyl-sulfate reductase [Thioclava sp. A2]MDV7271234.1 phosphoadenylyl-sulfate reductase [Thioclava sp. A2]
MLPETLKGKLLGLNDDMETRSALAVIETARAEIPGLAMVSSFGAESVVLLHLMAQVDRSIPVLFIDTEMLFPETVDYQQTLAETLGLTDIRRILPDAAEIAAQDPSGELHRTDPDACCDLRKTRTLERALADFDGWITGRKRHQTANRATLPIFEEEEGAPRIKVNPLANWERGAAGRYILKHNLPRHPLVAQGFASIGCAPCTSKVAEGEDPRAGRWRGFEKQECGIHIVNGRFVPMRAQGGTK